MQKNSTCVLFFLAFKNQIFRTQALKYCPIRLG